MSDHAATAAGRVGRLWAVDLLAMFGRAPAVPVGTYTTWSWPPTPTGYAEFRWTLEPRTDPSPVGYFWSHQVALVGGEAAYVGLQTVGSEPAGKIAIFSVWGGIDAEGPEYAAPFGGEGTGMTVRIRYGWVPGRRERLALRADGDGCSARRSGRPAGRPHPCGRDVARPGVEVDHVDRALHAAAAHVRRHGPCRRVVRHAVGCRWRGATAPTQSSGGGNRGCPGSSVRDTEGGVLHVMGAPG
jgi:hypothetical protein